MNDTRHYFLKYTIPYNPRRLAYFEAEANRGNLSPVTRRYRTLPSPRFLIKLRFFSNAGGFILVSDYVRMEVTLV